jgi:hypothetical protein
MSKFCFAFMPHSMRNRLQMQQQQPAAECSAISGPVQVQ